MVDFRDNPLFSDAPVAYSVVDAWGQQIAANQRFWDLFGYAPGTALAVADITHPDDLGRTEEYLGVLGSDGDDDLVSVEKRYIRADGAPFWGRLTARRILNDRGESLLLGVIENIDEQRRLETSLRDAALQQSEFVARVSHELRNPLHTIAGMAELLSGAGLSPEHRNQAEAILRETGSLTSIVSDLLDIGRIDAGNFAVEHVPFAVRPLIDRSVRAAETAAAAKALRLNMRVDDAVPINVTGDYRRIGQVLDNLIGNAIKFTAQGSVTIEVDAVEDDSLRFTVEDTGPGIPSNFVDKLYEPFERANESTTGAGLGLAISMRLAESMGGSLSLLHSSPEGATFSMRLPLSDAGAQEATVGSPLPASSPRQGRILVVEDNVETQMLASAQLDRLGYEYDVVGDGYLALEQFTSVSYGAILMDWHLPGMDGLETTRRIRQLEAREGRERTPIISVTARAMTADIEACREAGADDFVAKPASIGDIAEALDQWTGHPAGNNHTSATMESELFVSLVNDLGDPDIVRSLGQTFLTELPGRVETIIATNHSHENRIELIAHTLASTSVMFGAVELGAIAREIEDTARGSQSITDDQRHRLQTIAETTQRAMQPILKSLKEAT